MLQQIFNYNGNEITFYNRNGVLFVNATQMAKQFGKRPSDWLRTEQSERLIKVMTDTHKCTSADIVRVIKGGDGVQGTWMQDDVALLFAQWLSPEFYLWCNDHIKQMLNTGRTSLGSLEEDKKLLEAFQILQQRVETTTKKLEIANSTIQHQAPKVSYYDEVLDSKGLISTTIIAKDLGMSAEALNFKLNQMGIIFKSSKTWVPYSKYQDKGYCKSKTFPYTDADGKQKSAIHFYWTEAGREFVMGKFQKVTTTN